MSSTRWITETVEGSHEFNIEGYSLAKGSQGVGKPMTSGKFSVCGHDWVIVVYLDGNIETCKDYISVFVKLVSPTTEVRAVHEFKLLDKTGKGEHGAHYAATSPRTFNTKENSWGYSEYMKRSELETSSYLKGDCVTVHCTIRVVQTRVEEGKHYVIPIPPSNMSQNFKGLLESEFGTDITIQVGNESFKAHKSILAARSPVFKAMFFGVVGNPNMETVSIKEVDPFVFKAMLLFMYSDEFPETRELPNSDSPCTSTSILHHLLAAADRYDLSRLKLMCEERLCEKITADTVATTLALADLHQCLQLKTVCLNFAAKPKNLGEVMKSDGYAYLEKSCPSLLTDLLKINAAVDK
ncbi:hypothetical protein MKW92_040621 [Papaver armeniacum]|nr:hypothetical protein MKW92_040621 [Papaver armeniacum]